MISFVELRWSFTRNYWKNSLWDLHECPFNTGDHSIEST